MILQHQNTRHIYLADDDTDDRVMFAEALLEVDRSVILTEAENGEQLMHILQLPSVALPEVVFLDLNMPKLNGFECLEEIRKNTGVLQKLNVIMFTTSNHPKNIETAKLLGASYYAVKPNSFAGLKTLIGNVLKMDWSFSAFHDNKKFMIAS